MGTISCVCFSVHRIVVCRGVARLINWLGTAGLLTALIECLTVILEYIDLFKFLLVGHSQLLVGPGPYQAHPWLRLWLYVSRIAIPTRITENFTIGLDGHLLAKHQSWRVPQLETEITTVSSTVKTEVEKISTGRNAMSKTLPPSESIIGIEMKTDLPLSHNTETEMKKTIPRFKNSEVGKTLPQCSKVRNEVKRKLSQSVIDHVKSFVFFIGLSRKFCSGENFGPGPKFERKNHSGSERIFRKKWTGPGNFVPGEILRFHYATIFEWTICKACYNNTFYKSSIQLYLKTHFHMRCETVNAWV